VKSTSIAWKTCGIVRQFSNVAKHQFAEEPLHGGAARQGVGMAPISAEGLVALLHGDPKTRRDCLLSDRQVTGALDQVLKEKVVSSLLAVPNLDLEPEGSSLRSRPMSSFDSGAF
jgi:hypothetical protein